MKGIRQRQGEAARWHSRCPGASAAREAPRFVASSELPLRILVVGRKWQFIGMAESGAMRADMLSLPAGILP